ncbi:MAG: hypothetical protein M3Y84_11460, partial [Acidobacteriota bacterium]|nr:hypothetical protein [Acidobacteriota bacterium]
MSEVKLNLIDSQETLHGTIHGAIVDACVAALSAEPETIAELTLALARYIKALDEVSPFASFCSTKVGEPSEGVSQVEVSQGQEAGSNAQATATQVGMSRGQEGGLAPALLKAGTSGAQTATQVGLSQGQEEGGHAPALLSTSSAAPQAAATQLGMSPVNAACGNGRVISLPDLDTEPWDAGLVVIDLAARIVSCESTYSMPQPSGEVHYHDGTSSTDIPVLYLLPDDWLFVNSVEAYQWSRERRAAERLSKSPLDVRKILYGAPLLDFIVNECANIDVSKMASPAEHLAERAVADDAPEDAIADDAREDAAGQDALAAEISNIHARWLMTPREDLRGQSPREVLLARQGFIDFDLHTRSLQWTFLDEGPPCLPHGSYAYRFAGFGTHEFVIYYDLVRHLICSQVESRRNKSPTSNVQDPTSETRTPTFNVQSSIQLGMPQGEEGGHAPAPVLRGSSPTIREGVRNQHSTREAATQVGLSQGQEGGLAPGLLSASSTAAQVAATQLGMPQGEEGGHAPAPVLRGSSPTIREGVRNQHSTREAATQVGLSQG